MSDKDRVEAYVNHALLSIIEAYEIDALVPTKLIFDVPYDEASSQKLRQYCDNTPPVSVDRALV
jgi:hypothetical protein